MIRESRVERGRRDRPAILLTGAGKRYDIVSCFARLTTTVVADPARWRPRSTRRTCAPRCR